MATRASHPALIGWLLLTAGAGLAGCEPQGRCGPERAAVISVIDGDTIELAGGRRVRYLMIDAPEVTGSRKDCYGKEARDFNVSLVDGREVELTYDVECEDSYDRLLAYVRVQGREVNSLMVERGYACALYIPPNGENRAAEFQDMEAEARADERGMWGACEEVTCD